MDERQGLLFALDSDADSHRKSGKQNRNAPMFLRNQFPGEGKYGFPQLRRQILDLEGIDLIACTNTVATDAEYFDFGVHFFVDDFNFDDLYANPEKTLALYSQYRFCCTPDYSVYGEMPTWRQIESVAHSRWVGAWWQSRGLTVVPTISWDKFPSFDFCFEGIERGSVVAVATYACHQNRAGFLRGYSTMLEAIRPEAVICYGEPFAAMGGNVITVHPRHPRSFHRELKSYPKNCS